MAEPSSRASESEKTSLQRLDSWKEIAAYLNRDVTTVQRWEKCEGMPVHRHLHDKRGSVYALPTELDAWRQSRKLRLEEEEKEPSVQTLPAQAQTDTATEPKSKAAWLARGGFVLAGLVALGLLAVLYIRSHNSAGNAAQSKIKSLAVLPFKNLSGDPTHDYLADGMTEALIGRLAGFHDLRVISRTSVMRFKDTQLSVPEIAKTLHVDAIVEGSVIREGSRIRVTAQLIRGATDEHFWSETYDRELRDVLSLQSDVAQSIAQKVAVTITGEERARLTAARPVSPEVYESYSQGSYEMNKSPTKANIMQGIADFNDAIKRDPTFAPAYLGVATAYSELGSNFIGEPPDAEREKAISAARKALELDPSLADAHALLAAMLAEQWQWADAEAEYKNALELNPNDSDAYEGYAWWLLYQGRAAEGIEWGRRGRELDPFTVEGPDFAMMLSAARRYDEAIHELRAVLAARPEDPVALWDLGIVLTEKNQPIEAIPVLEKAVAVSDRSTGVIGSLIRAYALAGRRGDAIRLLSELEQRRKAGFMPAGAFVNAYVGLGDKDQAFAWLEQGYNERSNVLQRLKVDPDYDPLRGDPRFADLLRRVGLA